MIRFAEAKEAPVSSVAARAMALGLAGVLVIMAVGQLFTFDETIDVVARFGFVSSHAAALSYMAVVAVCEVLALPFLLRMRLSVLMRALSTLCGWIATLLWLKISVAATSNNLIHSNIGFFGEKVPVPVGWWVIVYSLLLVSVMALVTWAFWQPFFRHSSHKK